MSSISFRHLVERDLEELCQWHQDAELAHRYGGTHWPQRLWQIMQKESNRRCWIALKDDEIVGYVDVEAHDQEHLAWIGLAVKPSLRAKGLGKEILREFLKSAHVQRFREIKAGIEPDNIASVRCFSALGFQPVSEIPDEDGVIDYSLGLQ